MGKVEIMSSALGVISTSCMSSGIYCAVSDILANVELLFYSYYYSFLVVHYHFLETTVSIFKILWILCFVAISKSGTKKYAQC